MSGNSLDALADIWATSRSVVVLTGAGVSTASGIPDFRSPGGRWSNYQPVTLQAFQSDPAAREEYWRYKGETWQLIREAPPNPAHLALRDLAQSDHLDLLVTQNVDGLHERSGFPADRLIHIHGTDSRVQCLSCGRSEPREAAQQAWEGGEAVPCCPCGSWWKPATISFGQQLVADDLERAFESARDCDLFLAVGTSLVVSPIHYMFEFAARSGARTAILTASDTPFDEAANFKIEDPLEDVLPELSRRVLDGPVQG